MSLRSVGLCCAATMALAGCSTLEFSDGYKPGGATYYDPEPILIVKCDKDGQPVVEVTTMPGRIRSVRPVAGLLGGELSADFSGGMLTSFGQTNEALSADLISGVAGLFGVGASAASEDGAELIDEPAKPHAMCADDPPPRLFRIERDEGGRISRFTPLTFG
ncbi:hypothetical protein BrevBR_10865 [Brevundimonas sp. BR2-1]|uniref:hypothetical protein n=1 Tax=unclassified Brevundimonas TaxID=2622653 RepID=UPI002FC59A5D